MSLFALDTSGHVVMRRDLLANGVPAEPDHIAWPDLDAFTQGYIEAVFASSCPRCRGTGEFLQQWNAGNFREKLRDHGSGFGWFRCGLGFSDLAAETLARIIADCERSALRIKYVEPSQDVQQRELGAMFWRDRQNGLYARTFPPLTPTLGDDGKVYLAEVQS